MEKQRAELQRELDDLNDRLEEAGGNVQAQVCIMFLKLFYLNVVNQLNDMLCEYYDVRN